MLRTCVALALAMARSLPCSASTDPYEAEAIHVVGRARDLVGIASSASEGVVGRDDLERRPLLRPGELAETVPGVVISQHSGSGKANQYYARGFNLDHGTDFAASIDAMPINLRTHGHGQGYTDLNFLIPELVDELRYAKGTYFAENGDFSSVGSVNFRYARRLKEDLLEMSVGEGGFRRSLAALSLGLGPLDLLGALETGANQGPWDRPEDLERVNGVLKLSTGPKERSIALTLMSYRSHWSSSDQIPRRAVAQGLIGRFGTLDPSDGGNTFRRSLSLDLDAESPLGHTSFGAYLAQYELDLFSDFTYHSDAVHGDQFEQVDRRSFGGAELRHGLAYPLFGEQESALGLQIRADNIHDLGLFQTEARQRWNTLSAHQVQEASLGAFIQQKSRWADWLRSQVGARADRYQAKVHAQGLAANSGEADSAIVSPKLGLVLGPWGRSELYANWGQGFHSNDARGWTTTVDPSGADADGDGQPDPLPSASPLVKTRGTEFGVRSSWLPGLESSVAWWDLSLDSELVFIGDAGVTEAGRSSYRQGWELANYYSPVPWARFDLDYSHSQAFFTQSETDPVSGEGIGSKIPGSLEEVLSAGLDLQGGPGLFGGLRARYFGPRPLNEDGSRRSQASLLWNARLGCDLGPHYRLQADLFNIFNAEMDDVEYDYESVLRSDPDLDVDGAPDAVQDGHFHSAEPRQLRVTAMLKW